MILSKNVNNKKSAPKLIFFNEKKMRKIRIIFDIENWLWKSKIGNYCLITWFRAGVDLPENLFYEKVLFFTQLSYHLMCRLLKKSYMLSNIQRLVLLYVSDSLKTTYLYVWVRKSLIQVCLTLYLDQISFALSPT